MGEPASQLTESAPALAASRYRLLFPLGHGGMGTVHLALDEAKGGVRRMVAVKRMLPGDAHEPHLVELFLREARLAVLLNHPNVVRAFEFGELEDEPYLAMEYVEGKTLEKVLVAARKGAAAGTGGLPAGIVASILADVCSALHAVHELTDVDGEPLAVVHRDVSPHNVMVSYDGHVVLLDFGISKMDAGPKLTVTGHVRGKLAYMSPEQARSEPLDRRSDLFGVGSMLYEAITGAPLWGSGTDFEILKRVSTGEAPALAADPALCAIYTKLVAPSPEDRFATAKEAAAALQAYARKAPDDDQRTLTDLLGELFDGVRRSERQRIADAVAKREAVAPSGRGAEPPESAEVPAVATPIVAEEPGPREATSDASQRPVRRTWAVALAAGIVLVVGAALAVAGGDRATASGRLVGAEATPRRLASPLLGASSSAAAVDPPARSSAPVTSARARPAVAPLGSTAAVAPASASTPTPQPSATSDVDKHPF